MEQTVPAGGYTYQEQGQYEVPVDPMARWSYGGREAIARPQRRQGEALAERQAGAEYFVPIDPMQDLQCDSCQ